MRNGEARSAKWIARNLKKYKREDDVVQTLLGLVDVHPVPSLYDLSAWTDEQCLLAVDWASACHYSASDNNNRVPARPEHLMTYAATYPQRSPQQAAFDLVQAMSDDNGCSFIATAEQMATLTAAIGRMQIGGLMGACHFTDAEIELFAAGESSQAEAHFKQFDGATEASRTLNEIFDNPDV